MITAEDLRGAALIAATFMVLLATAEAWMRLGHPKPEWTRKLVHVGGGVISLFLPWVLQSALVVLILTASLSALFVTGGKTGLLKSLHGVERKSRGSEYYPLAIFLAFAIAADKPWLYLTAVLVLAVADAFAALVGSRYGVLRYEVENETKSIEGSIVFFIIAFLAVHIPTLLLTDLPRPVTVLSALLVAMLVTIFEAISLEGSDNIFVPIAVIFVMQKITTKPVPEIAYQILSLLSIVVVVALVAWRFHWFNGGGAMTVTLFTFATWSLASRRWSVPVFIALAVLVAIRLGLASRVDQPLRVRYMARALLVPFLFVLAANLTASYAEYYGPYLATSGAVLSFALWNGGIRLAIFRGWNRLATSAGIGVLCGAVLIVPMWLLYRQTPFVAVSAALGAIGATSFVNAIVSRRDPREWRAAPFLLAGLCGLAVLSMQVAGLVPAWAAVR